ncbi:MAG: DUF2202 domain-containing protein, partial [Christensenellaceae bacterium]|nr:DUF2202 domain-containing protein [Christensenellaceae bacterium]
AISSVAIAEETYTLEDMLQYAYQDELNAQALYNAFIEKFGSSRPTSNIVVAEGRHAEAIKTVYNKLNIAVPELKAAEVTVADTIAEAYKQEIQAEIDNIAMYEKFLAQGNLPEEVKTLFEYLKAGSENHLNSYERAYTRETTGLQGNNRNNFGRKNAQNSQGNTFGNQKNQGNNFGNGKQKNQGNNQNPGRGRNQWQNNNTSNQNGKGRNSNPDCPFN